ncbi:MAG: PEGA domain-containing protein, partial [Deltaproteobacteria bacterium]|nr:PEGA domain-containing protein [Deltaproteobacteria bacterium]
DRRTIPDETESPTAVAGSIEAIEPAPDAVSSGTSGGERKTMMFGDLQGPVSVPSRDASTGVSASPGRPMTVSARPVTGPTRPAHGAPQKKATGSRSLPAVEPSFRVSDGAAIEVMPPPSGDVGRGLGAQVTVHAEDTRWTLDPSGGVGPGGDTGGAPAGAGTFPRPEARALAGAGDEGFPSESANSSKMTVMDLGAGPVGSVLAASPPASRDAEEPASRRLTMAGTGEVDLQALAPGGSQEASSASAKKGGWPFSPSRGDLPTSFSSAPVAKVSSGDPAPPVAASSSEPTDFASRATAPFLGRGPSGEGRLASGHAASSAASSEGGGAYSEPVVAADRAGLSAARGESESPEGEGDDGASKAKRKRVQTGDWSHQGRDRRPGTHPFFKGDDGTVQASNFDNPYAQASKRGRRRSWTLTIILLSSVVLIGGAGAAAWWWFYAAGSEGTTIKITSRPSGATVFNGADGRALGKTPLRLDGKRFRGHEVEVHLAGYQVAILSLVGEKDPHVVLRKRTVGEGTRAPPPSTSIKGSSSTSPKSVPKGVQGGAKEDDVPHADTTAKSPSSRTLSPARSPLKSKKRLRKPRKKPKKKPRKKPKDAEGLKDPFG